MAPSSIEYAGAAVTTWRDARSTPNQPSEPVISQGPAAAAIEPVVDASKYYAELADDARRLKPSQDDDASFDFEPDN